MDNCSFHNHSSHCHQGSLSAKPIKPSIRKVTTDEKVTLKERANIVQPKPICAYHEHKLRTRDIFWQKFCCDPFNSHKSRKTTRKRTLLQQNYTVISDRHYHPM